jgi:hypothetical protein
LYAESASDVLQREKISTNVSQIEASSLQLTSDRFRRTVQLGCDLFNGVFEEFFTEELDFRI